MLRFEQVSVFVPGRCLVRDFSAEFQSGSLVALCGRNGSGKTSLLRAALGLRPSTGTISIDGELVHHLSFQQRAQKMAYVPQFSELRAPLSLSMMVEQAATRGAAAVPLASRCSRLLNAAVWQTLPNVRSLSVPVVKNSVHCWRARSQPDRALYYWMSQPPIWTFADKWSVCSYYRNCGTRDIY